MAFLQHSYQFQMLENVPLNSVIGTLLINRPNDRRIKYSVSNLPDNEFSVSPKGDLILRKMVDYEQTEFYNFTVYISDGKRNDSAKISVTLLNINDWDPRFKYPQYEFFVQTEDAYNGHLVGKLEVHDGDKGDSITMDLKGPYARIFRITSEGELSLNEVEHLNNTEAHLVAVARDSGHPPRETSVPVLVRFGRELLLQRIQGKDNDKFTLTVVLGLLLSVFLIISVGLFVYICKDKKAARKSNNNSVSNSPEMDPNPGRLWSNAQAASLHRSEPDLYMTATSTKSSSVTSLPQLAGSTQVMLNPLNPHSPNHHQRHPSGSIHQNGLPESSVMSSSHQALRESILGGTGTDLSRLQWPRNSIPRRVKKLSWEDEYEFGYDRDISTLTDPDNSVTPLELQLEPSQVGRAIYF